MAEQIKTVLGRSSPQAGLARPLIAKTRVLRAEVVRDLGRFQDELEALRQAARQEVVDAKEEAQGLRDRAREEGRREGLQEVMEELARARAEYGLLQVKAEQDMVTLAFYVAQRIIGHAVEVQPEVIRDIVGQALLMARGKREILVRVHPDDLSELEPRRAEFASQLGGVPVHFEVDSGIERGGCAIDTESGRIDARLETQLEVLREALLNG